MPLTQPLMSLVSKLCIPTLDREDILWSNREKMGGLSLQLVQSELRCIICFGLEFGSRRVLQIF